LDQRMQEEPQVNLRLTGKGKWSSMGWKNVCKLWLQERTPEELKGERD
jgi:hypothetical protein